MKLFHAAWSPNCQKIMIARAELGAEAQIEVEAYDPYKRRDDAFLAHNPAHRVPLLVDGECAIFESAAILIYIAKRLGGLFPDNPADYGLALSLMHYEASTIAPTIGGAGLFGELMKPEAERDGAFLERMRSALVGQVAVLESILSDGRDYFARSFSVADVQLYPGLSKVVAHEVVPIPEHLKRWAARVGERPAVRAAM